MGDESKPEAVNAKKPGPPASAGREAKLAAALRANLKRRKAAPKADE
jgi:hypothetical protein